MRGSAYKRGDAWTVRWDIPGPERRQRSKGGFKSKKEAERFLTSQLDRAGRGLASASDRMLLSDFADQWLEAVKPEVAHTTWKGYESKWRLYLRDEIGHFRIGDITSADLKALWPRIGKSPRTVQYARATLHKMFTDAMEWGIMHHNPADAARTPKVPKKPKETWKASDTARFLQHVEGDRWETMWWVLCDTACRRSELCNLTWDDVDLKAETVSIREGKTDSARRIVSLLPETVELLRDWRRRILEDRLAAGEQWRESGRLFVWPDGRPVKVDWVSHAFARLRVEAGVPRIKLHNLRHSWATQALREGVEMATVSARLGHSSIAVTVDFYADVPRDVDRRATEAVGRGWRARDAHGDNASGGSVTSIDADG